MAGVAPRLFLTLVAMLSLAGCSKAAGPMTTSVDAVVRYPHDPSAFTEGLLVHDGRLYESTGQYKASRLRRVDPASGRIEDQRILPDDEFGEGLARYGQRLYQLTWKAGRVHVYDLDTLRLVRDMTYDGEGWGLATCGDRLVMSNGSDTLFFRDPETFAITRRLPVTEAGRPVEKLNELEVIDGRIWANQWLTDRILVIDPADGRVVHVLDARTLAERQPGTANVLNGIAYDADRDRIYITGKYWPALYVVRNRPDPSPAGLQNRSARARCQSSR